MIPERPPKNACLFLDVDGTLIDIAPTPDSVVVPPNLVQDLGRAEQAFGGALALVSGRSIADLDRLFAPLALKASGVHGAEFRFGEAEGPVWAKATPLPDAVWVDLLGLLKQFPECLAENKAFSIAVHYRAAPATGPSLRAALERFLAARTGLGLLIMPGHCVYELKWPGTDKGAAIEEFMSREPFRGRRPVFIGDDVTDQPGFATVTARAGWAYSVRETVPGVAGTFADPSAVRRWLADVDLLEGRAA